MPPWFCEIVFFSGVPLTNSHVFALGKPYVTFLPWLPLSLAVDGWWVLLDGSRSAGGLD